MARYAVLQKGLWVEYPSITELMAKHIDKSEPLIQWAIRNTCESIKSSAKITSEGFYVLTEEQLELAKNASRDLQKTALSTGKNVHDFIELFVKNKIHPSEYHIKDINIETAIEQSCTNQFLDWERHSVAEWLETERFIFNSALGHCGRIDALARLKNGSTMLIDFKTSAKIQAEAKMQIAAYIKAREAMSGSYTFRFKKSKEDAEAYERTEEYSPIQIDGGMVLRLDKKGKEYEVKTYSKNELHRQFEALKGLITLFYNLKNRRLKNNPFVIGTKK